MGVPVTPARAVVGYLQQPDGATLRLDCGHERWVGGMCEDPEVWQCGQSPCYKPGKEWSN